MYSPLAQKRIILFVLRKQMIQRRAFSESARTVRYKGVYDLNREANDSPRQDSPKSDTGSTSSTFSKKSQTDEVIEMFGY